MKQIGKAVATLAVLLAAGCATAQTSATTAKPVQERKEHVVVPFRLESATIVRFDRPSRVIDYKEALELRLLVDIADYTSTPPSLALLLYVGPHALPAFRTDIVDERTIRLVYHDPRWREIDRAVPMVLTVLPGGPAIRPQLVEGAQQFHPRMIR